jgi:uncharacterized damage-inducible protein DinB
MGFHGFLRETLIWKCNGLTEDQGRWSPVASGTSLLSLLKHSINVERYWISSYVAGLDVRVDWTNEDPDADWHLVPSDTLAALIATYQQEADRTNSIISNLKIDDWDRVPESPEAARRGFSIGWVLTHMVEEVGRHCGHADIIRELLDGSVGE